MKAAEPTTQLAIQPSDESPNFLRLTALGAGWLLVLGISAMLVNRYLSIPRPFVILAAGLVPFLTVPIALCGLASITSQSKPLRIASAFLAGAYLLITAPHDAVAGCRTTAHDETISIIASNVLVHGATAPDVAAFVLQADSDVITLSEATGWFLDDIGPMLAQRYPYQSHELVDETNGSAIFSRWPLSNVENFPVSDLPSQAAEVDSPYGAINVIAVHTQAPLDSYTATKWQTQLGELRSVSRQVPTILAGDFNATEDHKPFRQLLRDGWEDVHDDKGCGLDNTWPTQRSRESSIPLAIPILRLDHVLVTDHFETLGVQVHDLPGSDHAPVEAHVRLTV